MLSRLFLTGAIVALALSSAGAQPAYLDDRSNPVMLIRSLYNAINRKEYARAYAYFEEPPAPTLTEYAAGYADTEHVEVVTGTATSEGAAGSIFYSLPVALEARGTDGEHRMYSGCYTFRFIQPAAQTTPYRPLSIVRGEMQEGEPAEGNLEDLLPPSCGDGEPVSVDPLLQKAERIFEAAYGDICDEGLERQPEKHAIRGSADDGNEATLIRFRCVQGAYTEGHVYLLYDGSGTLTPLHFALPELEIRYENDDPEAAVEEIRVIGYRASFMLADSFFDPQELSITSHAKWRGVGDISSTGKWLYRERDFTLVRYDVDASRDGEINPETVIDYEIAP